MAQDKSYYNDYYHRNKERINARRRELYAESEERREKQIDAAKAWAAAHPGAAKEAAVRAKERGYKRPKMTAEQIASSRATTRKWRREHKDEVNGYLTARRAMMREAKVGRISRRTLWAESGGVCAHCGQPIDPTIKYPDLMSLSYDHRVPLSKGGLHCQENMQCVHLVCNIKKRDSVPE